MDGFTHSNQAHVAHFSHEVYTQVAGGWVGVARLRAGSWGRKVSGAATAGKAAGGGDKLADSTGDAEQSGALEVVRVSKQDAQVEIAATLQNEAHFGAEGGTLGTVTAAVEKVVRDGLTVTAFAEWSAGAANAVEEAVEGGRCKTQAVENGG